MPSIPALANMAIMSQLIYITASGSRSHDCKQQVNQQMWYSEQENNSFLARKIFFGGLLDARGHGV